MVSTGRHHIRIHGDVEQRCRVDNFLDFAEQREQNFIARLVLFQDRRQRLLHGPHAPFPDTPGLTI